MLPVSQEIALRAQGQTLSAAEKTRFSRHILLPEIGLEGQARLRSAKVLVIGAGGLGSPVAYYLTAAGVGTLGLVEYDRVDVTNLQRQILFAEADVGKPKLAAAVERLSALSSHTKVEAFAEPFGETNAVRILEPFDIVVDGTDNFTTRYLINDTCVKLQKPNVYGSIFRFEGQASVFYPPHGPCYRCLFPAAPPADSVPNCAEGGVLGVLPGQIGLIQATETLKLICNLGPSLVGRLLTFDAQAMRFDQYKVERSPTCAACGPEEKRVQIGQTAPMTCDLPQVAIGTEEISATAYHALRQKNVAHTLLDVRSEVEVALVSIPGHLHIPLDALLLRHRALDASKPIIVYCKSGGRSLRAVKLLRSQGLHSAQSLSGGILGWIDAFAPEWPRY